MDIGLGMESEELSAINAKKRSKFGKQLEPENESKYIYIYITSFKISYKKINKPHV